MTAFGMSADTSVREQMDRSIRVASLTVLEFSWFKLARCLELLKVLGASRRVDNRFTLVSACMRFTLTSVRSASMSVSLIHRLITV